MPPGDAGWTDSPPGPHFQGVEFERGRWDPYWRLADASGYGDHGAPPADARLPALIELKDGHTADELRRRVASLVTVPGAYTSQRHCTAWVAPGFLAATQPGGPLTDIVERLELGLPLTGSERLRSWSTSQVRTAATRDAPKIVFGVIDTGCAFAHRSLRGPNGTRVRCIWDQESDPARVAFKTQPAPADLCYGREAWRDELDAWILQAGLPVDESLCHERAGCDMLRRARSHGMHVLDLLCGPVPPSQRLSIGRGEAGPGWQAADDAATQADVIFVQLPRGALEDASGGWLCVHVLDALRYIVARTEDDELVIVNLSYGSQLGPHDGSTTLEVAIQALCAEVPRLRVVFSAGNSFDRRAHAQLRLSGGESRSLTWHLPPDNTSAAFAEVWIPAGAVVTVELTPPSGQGPGSGAVPSGLSRQWRPDPAAMPLAEVCHLARTACGDGQQALLRIGPTDVTRKPAAPPHPPRWAAAPAGDWTVTVRCERPAAQKASPAIVEVHLYLSRNDPDLDQVRGSRNAHWKDLDLARSLRPPRDDAQADPAAAARRRGTLNWCFPAHGTDGVHPQLFVIGGHVLRPDPSTDPLSAHPPYASAGPSRGGAVVGPRASLPSEESPALPGIRAAGTRSAGVFRLIGTSVAAPQYARLLALNGGAPPAAGDMAGPVALFGVDGRLGPP